MMFVDDVIIEDYRPPFRGRSRPRDHQRRRRYRERPSHRHLHLPHRSYLCRRAQHHLGIRPLGRAGRLRSRSRRHPHLLGSRCSLLRRAKILLQRYPSRSTLVGPQGHHFQKTDWNTPSVFFSPNLEMCPRIWGQHPLFSFSFRFIIFDLSVIISKSDFT